MTAAPKKPVGTMATCATCGARIVLARVGGNDALWRHNQDEHREAAD